MSNLIYPPHLKYKTKFIPYKFNTNKMEMIEGTEISRKNKYWNKLYNKIDKLYRNPLYTLPFYILPKKTLLYRCSIYKNPLYFGKSATKSNLIYFGLDFVISIWIALEIKDKNNKINNFYLHIYELTKDITYKYIFEDNGTIPELDKNSNIIPCIHPQLILHGDITSNEFNELGTEISFPRVFNHKILINPIQTYKIDVNKLEKNRYKYIFQWDPKNALHNK